MKGLPRSTSRGEPTAQDVTKATIVVRNATVAVTCVSTAVGFGTFVIGDFPQGNILLLGAVSYLTFSGSGSDANLTATWNGDYSIGSSPTADVTLSGAEVDIIPSTAVGPAVSEVAPEARGTNATQVILDNTDGSLEVNVNVLIDAADITDGATVNLTVNGYLVVLYSVLGDD